MHKKQIAVKRQRIVGNNPNRNKNGAPPGHTKRKPTIEQIKTLAQQLTDLDPETNWTQKIKDWGLSEKHTVTLLNIFYLNLNSTQPNSFKKLTDKHNPRAQDIMQLIDPVFNRRNIPENYQEAALKYTKLVSRIQANKHHHGILFKPVEYGTPEFTGAEFTQEQLMKFYKQLLLDFTSPAAAPALGKILPNTPVSDEDIIENINKYVLERETLFDELFTPTEQEHLPKAIQQLTSELNAMTCEYKKYHKTILQHRNRLILEYKYKNSCPKTAKFIYKCTKEEFQTYRLNAKDSPYKKLFSLSYEDLQKAAAGAGQNRYLYLRYKEKIEAVYKMQAAKILVNLVKMARKHFFIPFRREPLSKKASQLLRSLKLSSKFKILPHGLEFYSEEDLCNTVATFDILYAEHKLETKELNLVHYIDRHFTGAYKAKIYDALSSGRAKSGWSSTEKIKSKSAISQSELQKLQENGFNGLYTTAGKDKFVILSCPKINNELIQNYKIKKAQFSEITDMIGFALVAEDYVSAEKLMECIETIYRDDIIEKENLFCENERNKAYRDVKYLIRIDDDICIELQIKTRGDKIIGDSLEHDTLYKNIFKLSEENLNAYKPLIYGLQWQEHLEQLDRYMQYYATANKQIEDVHMAHYRRSINNSRSNANSAPPDRP
ncbi:MAG: hypothetical protein LBQ83_00525 [Candidatus Margulisbacteria bacterium]|jgi:hypothetical protein|nr:hypothetical protein [Candidatus Margulisiibacteriota bacterium]